MAVPTLPSKRIKTLEFFRRASSLGFALARFSVLWGVLCQKQGDKSLFLNVCFLSFYFVSFYAVESCGGFEIWNFHRISRPKKHKIDL